MIIIEGMDNSGKSTLANAFGLEIVHPGPAPKTKDQERVFLREQAENARLPIVMDRVTCISQQIYQKKLFDNEYMEYLSSMLETPHCVLIYCRPPDEIILDHSTHVAKDYDTPEQLEYLKQNGKQFIGSYDKLMYKLTHIRYNYTVDDENKLAEKVLSTQFHPSEWRKYYDGNL